MEGFTVFLALVDAIPVLLFGTSMLLVATKFDHRLFVIGALLSFLAGCCKVAWKLILATREKDIKWLNKCFVPMQAAGWLLMILSFILGFKKINWGSVLSAVTSFPSILFFILWIVMMVVMVWYRKTRFKNEDAKKNWTAQIINTVGQAALFIAILFT